MRDMRDEPRTQWRTEDERDVGQRRRQQGYGDESEDWGQEGRRYGYGEGSGRGYGHGAYGQGAYGWRGPDTYGGAAWGRGYPGVMRSMPWAEWRGHEPWDESARRSGWRHAAEQRGPFAGRGPKGYRRSDERVREDVSDRLTDDPWLDAGDIEVGVDGGMVTLSGKVGSREDKRRAEDIAMSCSGVRDVINQIHVEQGLLDQIEDAVTGRERR